MKIGDKTKERFKAIMQNTIKGLGRRVQVYKPSARGECPNCFFDKSTNSSTGTCKWTALEANTKQTEYEIVTGPTATLRYKFFKVGRCPICKGKGFLETPRKVWVEALITWNPGGGGNNMSRTPAGSEGATVIELKTDPRFYELFKNCEKVIIDKIECRLAKVPMLRGLGNETVLVVTLFTAEANDDTPNEIIKNY